MIENLIRRHLRSFIPYTSARSEIQKGRVLLDANELSLGSPVQFNGIALNRYPDPNQLELRGNLARTLGIGTDQVFVGAGSDEIIDLLIRIFCEPTEDRVVVIEPTYGVYRVAAAVSGVEVASVELNEKFEIDVPKIMDSLTLTTKIIFLCSPNNPTGNLLKREDILAICRNKKTIVVLDQAYLEFADLSGDIKNEVPRFENLVVLRTLSKAWGLAGIRLGYCIANPLIVSYLLCIKAPYNINAVTSRLAIAALQNSEFLLMSQDAVRDERIRMERELRLVPKISRVYPSDANFLLVEFAEVGKVYEGLLSRGIVVRRRSEPRLKNCLRITIGTPTENEQVLNALKECS
jgi:histidinol-phosphate aminotransferase